MPLEISKALNYLYLGSHWFRSSLRILFSDLLVRRIFIVASAANLLSWLAAFLLARSINQELAVLHYNVVFGVDLIGPAYRLYSIPAVGLAIVAFNLLFASSVSGLHERSLLVMIASLTAIASVLTLLSLYFVYFVNFS